MAVGIYLYEIDDSFGPNVLAEYYLDPKYKISPAIIKEFEEKHIQNEFNDTLFRHSDLRYYSVSVTERKNLFVGMIFQEGDDLVTLKSILENIAAKCVREISKGKGTLQTLLKDEFNSIFTLIDKLKQPQLIKNTIDEKTKKMLDDGALQEARELIELGETIPQKLSEEVVLAEQLLNENFYKKAKKSFIKAADLAELIQEEEIVSYLRNKAEQVDIFPELLREKETIIKDSEKVITDIRQNQLHLYHELIQPVERMINISNSFEDQEIYKKLIELKSHLKRSDQIAKELFNLDKKIKDLFESL